MAFSRSITLLTVPEEINIQCVFSNVIWGVCAGPDSDLSHVMHKWGKGDLFFLSQALSAGGSRQRTCSIPDAKQQLQEALPPHPRRWKNGPRYKFTNFTLPVSNSYIIIFLHDIFSLVLALCLEK